MGTDLRVLSESLTWQGSDVSQNFLYFFLMDEISLQQWKG